MTCEVGPAQTETWLSLCENIQQKLRLSDYKRRISIIHRKEFSEIVLSNLLLDLIFNLHLWQGVESSDLIRFSMSSLIPLERLELVRLASLLLLV